MSNFQDDDQWPGFAPRRITRKGRRDSPDQGAVQYRKGYRRGIDCEFPHVFCCGDWLPCDRFTNPCEDCGTDYNGSGERLTDRRSWGQETGEHWTECI